MTTYTVPRPKSAVDRELGSADALSMFVPWFPGTHTCDRCGAMLAAVDGFVRCYSVSDYCCDEPGQFWRERGLRVCTTCAADRDYAAERLIRKRGARSGKLPTWANTKRRTR